MLPKIQNKLNAVWEKSTSLNTGRERPTLFQYRVFNEVSCCTRALDFKNGEGAIDLDRWLLATYPKQANVLIVCGHVSKKAKSVLRHLRAQLLPPQCIIFLGSCGAPQKLTIFSEIDADEFGGSTLYVPGCPVTLEDMQAAIVKFAEKTYAK